MARWREHRARTETSDEAAHDPAKDQMPANDPTDEVSPTDEDETAEDHAAWIHRRYPTDQTAAGNGTDTPGKTTTEVAGNTDTRNTDSDADDTGDITTVSDRTAIGDVSERGDRAASGNMPDSSDRQTAGYGAGTPTPADTPSPRPAPEATGTGTFAVPRQVNDSADTGSAADSLLPGKNDMRASWQRILSTFVDDPRGSVTEAAELVEEAVETLVATIRERERRLRGSWEGNGARADTEKLRLVLREYRSLYEKIGEL